MKWVRLMHNKILLCACLCQLLSLCHWLLWNYCCKQAGIIIFYHFVNLFHAELSLYWWNKLLSTTFHLLQELVNFVFKNKQTTTLYTTVHVALYMCAYNIYFANIITLTFMESIFPQLFQLINIIFSDSSVWRIQYFLYFLHFRGSQCSTRASGLDFSVIC